MGGPRRGPAALAGLLTMTWLTPQMDRLFMEGASGRRRFLDRIVFGFEPEHARRVSAYEKAMRERNRLLKEGRRDPSWLGALEDELAGHGVALAAARRHWVGRLSSAAGQSFGPFPVPAVAIDGAVEAWLDDMPALAAEDRFREALEAGRGRDAEAGGTGVGPHRSDLKVRHRDKDVPAAQCSTGEQKALLIALVLATARLGAAETRRRPAFAAGRSIRPSGCGTPGSPVRRDLRSRRPGLADRHRPDAVRRPGWAGAVFCGQGRHVVRRVTETEWKA